MQGRIEVQLALEIIELIEEIAVADSGNYCYCKAHVEGTICPDGDCDGCPDCPTGKARRILNRIRT